VITSRRNPRIRRLRALQRPAGRREQGCLLLEGTHLVAEALSRRLPLSDLLATPDWLHAHAALLGGLPADLPQPVSDEVLAALSTTVTPDGVVAVLPQRLLPGPPRRPDFLLVLDHLQDPGNLGTLMRLGLAAGIEAIWMLDGADPWQPKVLRASAGAALRLPVERFPQRERLRARLEPLLAGGMRLLATTVPGAAAGPGMPYWRHDWRTPTAVLLGNEARGLDADLARLCDLRVTVPHDPAVDSLNVAVAAAPLLLERQRQRLQATMAAPSRRHG
jgi:TrmH family RNA methyltransferase